VAKGTYSAGTAFLTVVPSFLGIEDAFKKQVAAMAAAADKDIASGVARGLNEANRQAKERGTKGGKDYAGAYAAEARKVLDKAWRSLPEPQPDVNLRKWDRALASIRSEMKELAGQRIGIDIDRATFDRALDDFRRRLEELRNAASGPNKEIGFFNADSAARQLAEFQRFADEVSRRAGDAGEQTGSAFNQRFAQVLRDGVSRIPPIRVGADSTEAEQKLAGLRDRMLELADKQIGVNIDAGAAFAELRALQSELNSLDRRDVRVDIRTNAHEAATGMSAFISQAQQAGQSTQDIGTRANFSLSRLEYLIALGASLGTSIVPAAAAAAGAIGLIGTAAVSAVAGIGVVALGLGGVSDAVKALNGYAQDQAKSANSVDQANRRMASSTDQVRLAQMSLANTQRHVAEAAADAGRRVADAERGVGEARRAAATAASNAAREVADARRGVAEAEEAVGDARRQAALDVAEANRQVRDAQRAVTDAEQDALDVRKSLNEALEQAVLNMEELDVKLSRNAVNQQKAVTAQMEALEELNRLKTNPRASEVELRQAQDAYDEQTQRIKELQLDHKELAADKKKYDREGIEGDQQVIAVRKRISDADAAVAKARERLAREEAQRREVQIRAADRISDAQDRVARAQDQVARAQQSQREAEIRGQERVADAQRQVADARRAQARQALDGQFQLAQASNAVTQAQRAQQQAWEKTGVAGGAALEKLNQSMASLSPAAQRFAKFLFGLKDEVLRLRAAAAEPMLPRFEEAINLLLPYLPAVERFVGKVAAAMGELAVRAAQAFGSPVWQRFFHFVDQNAVPSLNMLYETGQNITQGLISLFLALTPFNDEVGTGLVDLSRDFALWAERLDKSQGYRDFLDYVRENGPKVVHFLGEMGELLIDLVRAAAPLGAIVLSSLTLLVDALNSIPSGALTGLVFGIGAVALGLTSLGAIMRVVKFRQQLTDIFGPRTSQMVQTYALDTGRATEETSRFGRATATASGLAAAARDRVQGYSSAVAAVPGRLRDASTGNSVFGRSMDSVRTASLSAAAALNGPAGIAGAAQAAGGRVMALGTAAGAAATGGMNRFKVAMLEVATAANGPGGMGAATTVAAGKVGGLAKSAGNAATAIGGKLVSGLSSASAVLGGPWGLALAGATIAIGTLAAASANYNGKIATLKSTLESLGTEYRDLGQAGKLGTPDATKMLNEIAQQNPEMRQAVLNLNSIGVSMQTLGRAAAGSQRDLQTVMRALDEEIDLTEQKWKDQSNFLTTVWTKDARQTSDRLEQLRQLKAGLEQQAAQGKVTADVQRILNGEDQRSIAITAIKTANQSRGVQVQQQLIGVYDANAARIQELNGLLAAFGTAEGTATDRANAMRGAIERQTGAAINAIETDEAFNRSLISLRTQVDSAKAAHDRHATSLSMNTTTGLANRDALQEVARSIREMYLQDIASGKPMSEATKAHNNRITALKEEAKRLGLTESDTRKLIKAYGDVDPSVTTKFSTKDFAKVYNELKQLKFVQEALAKGWSVEKAKAAWNAQAWWAKGNQGPVFIPAKATGGPIEGPGGPTSDDVLMWGSDGEWVHQAKAVDYYGESVMKALNERRIPREALPGYAAGGRVQPAVKPKEKDGVAAYAGGGRVTTVPMPIRLADTKIPTMAQVIASAQVPGFHGLSPDASVRKLQEFALAQRGKRYLWAAVGPRAYDCSGLVGNLYALATGRKLYRRYMSTGDMGPGRHGMVSGPGKHMTIYLGPGHTAANVGGLHVEAHGGNGTPLAIGKVGTRLSYYNRKLHLPGFAEGGMVDPSRLQTKQDRMISFLRYGWPEPPPGGEFGALLSSPLVTNQFDEGGMIPPGYSTVYNGTGQPEAVLTNQQWRDISELARAATNAAAGRGNVYNYEFRDTTLTPAYLRAQQDREAVLARDGRAR
jgi:cell wall-associated NlpC family hydrolase